MLRRIIKTITDFPSKLETTFAFTHFSKLELFCGSGGNKLSTREEAVLRISKTIISLFLVFLSAKDLFTSFVC
jgi:hypothetical protein